MATINYKEKYNKLVEAIKVLQETNLSDEGIQNWVNDNVPELAESEDEKIRKALIRFHKSTIDIDGIKGDKIVFWIEKQGEQKPISHKFRIGDKVKKGYLTYTVEDIDEDSYKLQAYSKDGDKGCTVFLTIGYEKDYELVEQKPVWSEEDERELQGIIDEIEANKNQAPDYDLATYDRFLSWLKSIRPQNRWKPSDEQMNDLKIAIDSFTFETDYLQELYEDLKKLKGE